MKCLTSFGSTAETVREALSELSERSLFCKQAVARAGSAPFKHRHTPVVGGVCAPFDSYSGRQWRRIRRVKRCSVVQRWNGPTTTASRKNLQPSLPSSFGLYHSRYTGVGGGTVFYNEQVTVQYESLCGYNYNNLCLSSRQYIMDVIYLK